MDKEYYNLSVGNILMELDEIDKINEIIEDQETLGGVATLGGGGIFTLFCCS